MSAAFQLHPYQAADVETIRDAFRRFSRVLYQLPTGGGKTVIFVHIIASSIARGRRVCILVHRIELVEQTSRTLAAWGISHGIIAPAYARVEATVQIASIFSLARRLASWADAFDFMVVDECHHAVAVSWQTILDAYPKCPVLGVTATPERLDGRGLGEFFEYLIVGPSTSELTKLGFLAPAVVYAPSRTVDLQGIHTRAGDYDQHELAERMLAGGLVGGAVEHYRELADGIPAIAFCVGIKHSLSVAETFVRAGYRARHVDGETPAAERRAAMAGLTSGAINVITNCSLISEGFDAPAVGALLIMRPTQSLGLHLQMIGRALRPAPGKDKAIILDHAGNTFRHGLPDQDRAWSLDAGKRKAPGQHDAPVKTCPECGAVMPAGARSCQACGFEFAGREIDNVDGKLVEITADPAALTSMSYRQVLSWAGGDLTKLHHVARVRGYKHGWVYHRMRDLQYQQDGESAS